jgi:hypothetical protein
MYFASAAFLEPALRGEWRAACDRYNRAARRGIRTPAARGGDATRALRAGTRLRDALVASFQAGRSEATATRCARRVFRRAQMSVNEANRRSAVTDRAAAFTMPGHGCCSAGSMFGLYRAALLVQARIRAGVGAAPRSGTDCGSPADLPLLLTCAAWRSSEAAGAFHQSCRNLSAAVAGSFVFVGRITIPAPGTRLPKAATAMCGVTGGDYPVLVRGGSIAGWTRFIKCRH